jgi:DNA-binding NarL/FixJ family response regulator
MERGDCGPGTPDLSGLPRSQTRRTRNCTCVIGGAEKYTGGGMNERVSAEQVRSVSSVEVPASRTGRPATVPVRVVIVDDHTLLREGTIQLLEQQADVTVVGQAGSGEEALEILGVLSPDVALIDVNLPGMSGLALARAVAASLPGVRVLILSAYDDYAYVAEALEIGVGGYLLKTATTRELVNAVRAVAEGVFVLDQALSSRLTRRRRGPPAARTLTQRERDVLGVLAQGRSNQQIAAELGLGQRTVEGHVSSVLGKLGVSSRAEAVAYVLSHRFVPPEHYGDSNDAG